MSTTLRNILGAFKGLAVLVRYFCCSKIFKAAVLFKLVEPKVIYDIILGLMAGVSSALILMVSEDFAQVLHALKNKISSRWKIRSLQYLITGVLFLIVVVILLGRLE